MNYVTHILSKRNKSMIAPRVICCDGFSLSVQASEYHYCSPRAAEGPYMSVEVGFPSEYEPLLAPYADEDGEIFAFVPVSVVNAVIEKHGGISKDFI